MMKRVSVVSILAISLAGLLSLSLGNPSQGKISSLQSGAFDEVTAFEFEAGYNGRSELYARQQNDKFIESIPQSRHETNITSANFILTGTLTHTMYLPSVAYAALAPMVERRGIWITRYDWTSYSKTPVPDDIYKMVNNVSNAGFNTIFFQIRAAGDSFYTPGLEPWSARLTTGPVSETLGIDPGWDPLAVMLQSAHTAGIEVHAYFNVYTAWLSPPDISQGLLWPPVTTPPQMFDLFTYSSAYGAHPGLYALGYKWRQYLYPDTPMALNWNHYLWASPGVDQVQNHIASVAADILSRYAVDGIHLDLVRYAGPLYSYDPFSNVAAGVVQSPARADWQRDRVTALVTRISENAHMINPDSVVSAAVWPVYIDQWGWGASEGYHDYFQDSKGWIQQDVLDAIAPMLYGGVADDIVNWQILMMDFINSPGSGQVYPGIGVYDDFSLISERIHAARQAGTKGHIIFSYSGLNNRDYWDDMVNGPYQIPAVVPAQ